MSHSTFTVVRAAQVIGVSTAFLAAGGIATLSLFDVPLLRSQPSNRSLPMIRWLFSRGSHIFPQAAVVSSTSFAYLAYNALPSGQRTLPALLRSMGNGGKAGCYMTAAILTFGIAPFTMIAMIPTNFALIQKNEDRGGARSAQSAKMGATGGHTAEESVDGKDDINQLTDLSGPQEKTKGKPTREEDDEVQDLIARFSRLNGVRAVLMGLGGFVGLIGALGL